MSLIPAESTTPVLQGISNLGIAELVNLLPDFSTSDSIHNLYVNHVAGALPGSCEYIPGTPRLSFRQVFYPKYTEQWPEEYIEKFTGLERSWWEEFSVAVLCQIIANIAHDSIRSQMLSDKINEDIRCFNETLLQSCSAFLYSRVLMRFQPIMNILGKLDIFHQNGLPQQYRQALIDNIFVRQLWFASGFWNSPDWEIYNHYAKYMLLFAKEDDVDTLIDALVEHGLPIPDSVGKTNWRRFNHFLQSPRNVDGTSLKSAAEEAVYATAIVWNLQQRVPQGNCYAFLSTCQQARKYVKGPPQL